MPKFNPDTDIPSLEGKVYFVTGGTAGIGRLAILNLVKHKPAHIYFSGRSSSSANSLISEVRSIDSSVEITFVQMDLASLASVKKVASQLSASMPRLDVLVCNAGIMAVPGAVSPDGYETHFATNHIGHAMLIRHLLPVLEKTTKLPNADVRLVILSSTAWQTHPKDGITYSSLREGWDGFMNRWMAYGQSKFANLIYAAELARRHPSILTVSLQPGVVLTGLVENLGFWDRALVKVGSAVSGMPRLTPEEGCHNSLWAAAAGDRRTMVNGAFYMPVGELGTAMVEKDKLARDPEVARKLWEWTEEVLDKHV